MAVAESSTGGDSTVKKKYLLTSHQNQHCMELATSPAQDLYQFE